MWMLGFSSVPLPPRPSLEGLEGVVPMVWEACAVLLGEGDIRVPDHGSAWHTSQVF